MDSLNIRISRCAAALALASALSLAAALPAQAQTETVLHSFGTQSGDGSNPYAGLIMDPEGNLYGTTYYGGAYDYGTVFKLAPSGTETVLYSFGGRRGDGWYPQAGLIIDTEGNLYGTTSEGGAYGYTNGTVFKLTSSGTETVLYSFHGFGSQSHDGYYPLGGLIMDTAGNLYGTTAQGGTYDLGTVFKLTPSGTETLLYSFVGQPNDGARPYAGLITDKAGNLYGTTAQGGYGFGTVFKVTPSGTETVLHRFLGDGASPFAGLIMDENGNLYGTTYQGRRGYGTVFELSATGKATVLYSFTGGSDGANPTAGLVMDENGNLYGAAAYSEGTVFELSPGKKGAAWTFTLLHAFGSQSGDGIRPFGTLILDKEGNLYGTTYAGGANAEGAVFKVTP